MRVLIDGKEVEVQNDIRVLWDGDFVDPNPDCGEFTAQRDEFSGHLQMVATHEGIILDTFEEHTPDEHENRGTASMTVEDLSEFCK